MSFCPRVGVFLPALDVHCFPERVLFVYLRYPERPANWWSELFFCLEVSCFLSLPSHPLSQSSLRPFLEEFKADASPLIMYVHVCLSYPKLLFTRTFPREILHCSITGVFFVWVFFLMKEGLSFMVSISLLLLPTFNQRKKWSCSLLCINQLPMASHRHVGNLRGINRAKQVYLKTQRHMEMFRCVWKQSYSQYWVRFYKNLNQEHGCHDLYPKRVKLMTYKL